MSSSARKIAALAIACFAIAEARAQTNSAIEQARLFQNTPTATNTAVNADGMALGNDVTSDDDSFGTQVILKERERIRNFTFAGDASVFYTDNAELTRHDKSDDVLYVVNAGLSWTPQINPRLEAQVAAHGSVFRYNSTSALDFENLGVGAGLVWSPENVGGVVFFARYDFIEILDRHSAEILRDHEFAIGGQKVWTFGKSQAFTLGATATGGIAEPSAAQRQQAAAFLAYHVQIARGFDADLFYKLAGHFYNRADRNDLNQIIFGSLRYRLSRCADLNAFVSFGTNRSDRPGFDYDVLTSGGGLGFTIRF